MACPGCGVATFGDGMCADCKSKPRPAAAPVVRAEPPKSSPETLAGRMVPTGNRPALAAYYLAFAALIPGLFAYFLALPAAAALAGAAIGVVAVLAGMRGIALERAHPAARGGAHAWFGVVFGGAVAVAEVLLALRVVSPWR